MQDNKTVATITKKDLETSDPEMVRSIIHFLHGKPDSDYEIFHDNICVGLDHLTTLNEMILSKIRSHTSENLCKVSVSLSENKIKEFSSWEEFRSSDWRIHYLTKNLSITWDFFITLPEFTQPQRHSLNVKIVSRDSSEVFFPAYMSDPDKFQDTINKSGTVVARVDFINHRLGQELLNLVRDWNNQLPKKKTSYDKAYSFAKKLEDFAEFSMQFGAVLVYSYAMTLYFSDINTVFSNPIYMIALILFGLVVINAAKELSDTIYYSGMRILRKYRLPRIKLTNGDIQNYDEILEKRKSGILAAFLKISSGLLLNVIGGLLLYYF